MFSWTAFALTILLGPVVFLIWSRVVYRNRSGEKWPVGAADSVGDVIALPLFNGFAFGAGLPYSLALWVSALITGGLIAFGYAYAVRKERLRTWSISPKGGFNAGGYYHLSYLLIETAIIFVALFSHPTLWVLWVLLGVFFAALAYHLFER